MRVALILFMLFAPSAPVSSPSSQPSSLLIRVSVPTVPQYDAELVHDGSVVARSNERDDTMYPCCIRIPDWISSSDRAHSTAKYYLYYSEHHGNHISMKWSSSIRGPWLEFDLDVQVGQGNDKTRLRGVMDFKNDPLRYRGKSRESYTHIAAPEVFVDEENEQFILFYHGDNKNAHETFAATSYNGLNFNDPLWGGQVGHGPQTVIVGTEIRDTIMNEAYIRIMTVSGTVYSFGKRGEIRRPRDPENMLTPNPSDPFGVAWEVLEAPDVRDWMKSAEFAAHPNNPVPGSVVPDTGREGGYCNHNSVFYLEGGLIEYMFWVRFDPGDLYNSIYRIVWDVRDSDWTKWSIARDENGRGIFDVVVTPEQISDAVKAAHPTGVDPVKYADPTSLGSSYIFADDNGRKYLFFSYYSKALGGKNEAEGQIATVELVPV